MSDMSRVVYLQARAIIRHYNLVADIEAQALRLLDQFAISEGLTPVDRPTGTLATTEIAASYTYTALASCLSVVAEDFYSLYHSPGAGDAFPGHQKAPLGVV